MVLSLYAINYLSIAAFRIQEKRWMLPFDYGSCEPLFELLYVVPDILKRLNCSITFPIALSLPQPYSDYNEPEFIDLIDRVKF